jgi:hypothetical protein
MDTRRDAPRGGAAARMVHNVPQRLDTDAMGARTSLPFMSTPKKWRGAAGGARVSEAMVDVTRGLRRWRIAQP